MKQQKQYPDPFFVQYRNPPVSGNKINGLGETTKRRAQYVYHSTAKTGPLPWEAMQTYFRYSYPLSMLFPILKHMWSAFRPQGEIADEKLEVTDKQKMADRIREKARELGAGITGICELQDEHLMDGASRDYKYAISIGMPMDREIMLNIPTVSSSREVNRVYTECSRLTVDLARYIRSLGWPALGLPVNSSSGYLHIPIAISAGLGQLGKHGSLICKEYGSNVRLTTVLTDLPLALEKEEDIGVDDVCIKCRACTNACPPNAIDDEKQWVRGTKKWYVDFDRCVPYFSDTYGCAICLEVCPWSESGRGPKLSKHVLSLWSFDPKPAD